MSLDATLENINDTLLHVANLLKAIEIAVLVLAITLALALIGCTATYYYSKYKQYHKLPDDSYANSPIRQSPKRYPDSFTNA